MRGQDNGETKTIESLNYIVEAKGQNVRGERKLQMTSATVYHLKKGRADYCRLLYTGAMPSVVANATNSEFLQEATNLVQFGSTLELRKVHNPTKHSAAQRTLLALESKRAEWKGVTVRVTRGGHLVVDRQILGTNTAYATLLPEASADLQELQILNLQRRPVSWGWGGSAPKRDDDDTSVFLVYLKTGTSCYAYSQRGLFKVEVCS